MTEMQTARVTIARLVRETATVTVRYPKGMDKQELAHTVYEETDPDWEADVSWGADEGTHTVATTEDNTEPDYEATERDGVIELK